jgi:hypothetical protein
MRWLSRYWYVLLFVLVNLAVAQPADAGLQNDICEGPGGETFGCCAVCWFFCECDYIE